MRPAAAVLQSALKTAAGPKTEMHRLLATSYAEDAKPDLDKAPGGKRPLSGRSQAVAGGPAGRASATGPVPVSPASRRPSAWPRWTRFRRRSRRGRAIVLRGQILYEEGRSLIGKTAATVQERRAARRKFEAAIEALRLAQSRDTVSNVATRQAMYLTGLCLRELGDRSGALGQLARTAKLFADYPEGLVASLQEGELARESKRDADALAAYRRAGGRHRSGAFLQPVDFAGPVAVAVLAAYRVPGRAEFPDGPAIGASALSAAAANAGLGVGGRSAHALGANAAGRGRAHAARQGRLAPPPGACAMAAGGRRLPAAGATGGRRPSISRAAVAERQRLPARPGLPQRGADSAKVREERDAAAASQALLALGQALLAMDDSDKALAAFEECVLDHPRDAAAYRGRLLAAGVRAEKGQFQQAEALLQENLSGEHLTPDSKESRGFAVCPGRVAAQPGPLCGGRPPLGGIRPSLCQRAPGPGRPLLDRRLLPPRRANDRRGSGQTRRPPRGGPPRPRNCGKTPWASTSGSWTTWKAATTAT